jgi:hypothetical protein
MRKEFLFYETLYIKVRPEVCTAVTIKITIFSDVTAFNLVTFADVSEKCLAAIFGMDGGGSTSTFFRNDGKRLSDYTTSHPGDSSLHCTSNCKWVSQAH